MIAIEACHCAIPPFDFAQGNLLRYMNLTETLPNFSDCCEPDWICVPFCSPMYERIHHQAQIQERISW